MSDTASMRSVINRAAHRRAMRLFSGTSSVWLAALVLSCWAGTGGGIVLAQATNADPTTQNGDTDLRAAAPHGEITAGSKCPITAALQSLTALRLGRKPRSPKHHGPQRYDGWGHVHSGLVAESVEPEGTQS